MKIEKTVQLDLIELINYIQENDIRDMVYNGDTGEEIEVTDKGKIISLQGFNDDSTFTLKIFKDITEDAKLDLIERFIVNNKTYYTNPQKMSINTCLEAAPDDIVVTHFYIENDNRDLILIWRDGRMVE